MNQYISPIAVDLGAKNTGVVFTHYIEGAEPISHKGVTFVLDVNHFTVSQKERLGNRHRMRGEQRRKLSKRLFFLILEKEYGLKQEQSKIWEFIRGLLNRRGFTYLQENNEEEEEIAVPIEFAKYIFPEEFKDCKEDVLKFIREQAEEDVQKALAFWKKLSGKEVNKEEKEELEKRFESFQENHKEDYNKNQTKEFLKQIKNTASGLIKEIEQGNKPRAKYLEEIWTDIQNNTELEKLLSNTAKPISIKEFYHLIGHISNMQLRGIRKYFNDLKMANGNDYWKEERLTKYYLRWLKSWHVPKDKPSKQHQANLIRQVEKENKSVLQLFFDNDPKTSIPPYEDQNNRRIPTCQSLLLSATYLDEHYKGWREMTKKISERNATDECGKVFQKTFDFYDESSIKEVLRELTKSLQGYAHGEKKKGKVADAKIPFDRDSILLHRIMETSRDHDIFRIRMLVEKKKQLEELGDTEYAEWIKRKEKRAKLIEDAEKTLTVIGLNEKEKNLLLNLAEQFYSDSRDARDGIWDSDNSVLAKCDAKTKHKNKMQQEVVEQILRYKFESKEKFQEFKDQCWLGKVNQRSTVKSLCVSLEKDRKEYGNLFKEALEQYNRNISVSPQKENKSIKVIPKDEIKIFSKVNENVQLVSSFIGNYLQQDTKTVEKYKNPFSLAQLSNILEGEPHGFFKISAAAQLENSWRGELVENKNGDLVARATNLSADTGRPFDGQLDRIVTRIAKEITSKKLEQIRIQIEDGDKIDIPVLMENNQFSFTEEILDLKKAKNKAKNKAAKTIERSEGRLMTKDQRIKEDCLGVCPYTGEQIGSDGEVDHIIPRSLTKGTILNSELNLIYASYKGNQEKGNKEYSLENIHRNFLTKHFQTTNLSEVKNKLDTTIQKVLAENKKESRNYVVADSLTTHERICFKLALFDRDLRAKVQPFLQTHSKAVVNGTQAWLFKRLKEELSKSIKTEFPNSQVKIVSCYLGTRDDDYALKNLREEKLAKYNTNYAKPEGNNQTEGSHIIDAAMVFAQSLIYSTTGKIPLKSALIKDETIEDGAWLESLLPEEIEIKYIERKPKYRKENPESSSLFKSGMYAERFLSLLVDNNGIRFGFTSAPGKASDPIKSKYNEEIFSKLKPFLLYKGEFVQEDYDYYSKLASTPKYSLLKLHRNKVKEYLQTCSKDDELGNFLESMRYITKNVPVFKEEDSKNKKTDSKEIEEEKIPETNSKKEKNKEKERKEKTIVLNVENPIKYDEKGNPEKTFFEEKKSFILKMGKQEISKLEITMPYVDEWKKLKDYIQDAETNEEKRTKAKEFFLFEKRIRNNNKHNTTGRKLSLPVESTPSGGFRIQRTNEFDEKIYQVQTGEDFLTKGFHLDENGNINLNDPAMANGYITQKVNTYKISDRRDSTISDFAYLDEWREVNVNIEQKDNGIERLFISPNTKGRCKIRAQIKTDVIKNLLGIQNDNTSAKSKLYCIDFKGKKESTEFKNLSKYLNENICSQKDSIALIKVSQNLTDILFTADGFLAPLKSLYNQGTKVENP